MRFKDDWAECAECGEVVTASDKPYMLVWRGKEYCSSDCLHRAMYDDLHDEVDELPDGFHWHDKVFDSWEDLEEHWEEVFIDEIDTRDLWDAEDKEFQYGDMQYDAWRDEQIEKGLW